LKFSTSPFRQLLHRARVGRDLSSNDVTVIMIIVISKKLPWQLTGDFKSLVHPQLEECHSQIKSQTKTNWERNLVIFIPAIAQLATNIIQSTISNLKVNVKNVSLTNCRFGFGFSFSFGWSVDLGWSEFQWELLRQISNHIKMKRNLVVSLAIVSEIQTNTASPMILN
jgi:hypothetical protein